MHHWLPWGGGDEHPSLSPTLLQSTSYAICRRSDGRIRLGQNVVYFLEAISIKAQTLAKVSLKLSLHRLINSREARKTNSLVEHVRKGGGGLFWKEFVLFSNSESTDMYTLYRSNKKTSILRCPLKTDVCYGGGAQKFGGIHKID